MIRSILNARNARNAILAILCAVGTSIGAADAFTDFLKPVFEKRCVECHGKKKTKGKVDLYKIQTLEQLAGHPKMVMNLIEAIDAYDMPPEDEPELDETVRLQLIKSLKDVLKLSAESTATHKPGLYRLNRFQYANAVQDLFKLRLPLFPLPEKMMTRFTPYVTARNGKMPDEVHVRCDSLNESGHFRGVIPYPKDLRAEHGFDNQGSHLTLSPLLLDSFMKLSVSIVESPDFTPKLVASWPMLFAAPAADSDTKSEVEKRLSTFMPKAFRREVDQATLDRYRDYALHQIQNGLSFTDAMKKVTSAVLSSPMFLFQSPPTNQPQYELASKLSFFLWGSGPDEALLTAAKNSDLSSSEAVNKTIDRMLANPKIERFLDAFPAQWMQLENIMAATPDDTFKYYRLPGANPASTHMVLEPLLLFDTVFVENRSVIELLSPSFTYQSDFLKKWYASDMKVPPLTKAEMDRLNAANEDTRTKLSNALKESQAKLAALLDPIRENILALTPTEVAATAEGKHTSVSEKELMAALTPDQRKLKADLTKDTKRLAKQITKMPVTLNRAQLRSKATKKHENQLTAMLRDRTFTRMPVKDQRYGGIITNAAALTMTSGPKHTKPISRGAWMIEVVFNDPPPPPPNDVPPLDEEAGDPNQTIREKFAKHRENERCASCHTRIDPLGFALENYDSVGRWRDHYDNKRDIDASGKILKKYEFNSIVELKKALVKEDRRFAKAFTTHLMRYALGREIGAKDAVAIDRIIEKTEANNFRLKNILREIILSNSFRGPSHPLETAKN